MARKTQITFSTGDLLTADFLNQVPRANFEQLDDEPNLIPLTSWKYDDGSSLDTTGAAGNPKIVQADKDNGDIYLEGENAQSGEKVEIISREFAVPFQWRDAEQISISVWANYTDAGSSVMTSNFIDVKAYEVGTDGVAGADICSTAAQTLSTTSTEFEFVISNTYLSRADSIVVYVILTLQGDDSAAVKNIISNTKTNIGLQ